MSQPILSIIIPTFQSTQINHCLQALNECSSLDLVKEILIVGQQDHLELPENLPCRYIAVTETPSPPKNRNIGAASASRKWLLFMDSDCLPSPSWIDHFVRSIKERDMFYAGSVDLPRNMNYWSWCDHLLGFGDQVKGVFNGKHLKYTASINFMVERNFFLMIGGFDESFLRAGEDLDFSTRAVQNGQQINFVSEASVFHCHSRNNFTSAWKHLFQFGEGTVHLRMKNRDHWSWIQKIGYQSTRIWILGELVGLIRILARALIRPVARPSLLRFWNYLPGVVILDLAHTLGMIYNFRVYFSKLDNKSQNN